MRWVLPILIGLLVGTCVACRRVPVASPPEAPASGTVEIRLSDALTGEPIQYAAVVGYDWGQVLAEATPSGYDFAPDGIHQRYVDPMEGQVRFAAEGYAETWTEVLRVSPGETKRIEVAMLPLCRLEVSVHDANRDPVVRGTLLIRREPEGVTSLMVRDGEGSAWLEPGTVRVAAEPRFMKGYRPLSKEVVLRRGEVTRLTLRLETADAGP